MRNWVVHDEHPIICNFSEYDIQTLTFLLTPGLQITPGRVHFWVPPVDSSDVKQFRSSSLVDNKTFGVLDEEIVVGTMEEVSGWENNLWCTG